MVNSTNSGSGSPGEALGISDYRRRWRRAGMVCLGLAVLMAWQGASMSWQGWLMAVLWWGGLLLLLGVALYTVVLDLRYTALIRKLEERRIFLETFGDPEFRRQVRAVSSTPKADGVSPPASSSLPGESDGTAN